MDAKERKDLITKMIYCEGQIDSIINCYSEVVQKECFGYWLESELTNNLEAFDFEKLAKSILEDQKNLEEYINQAIDYIENSYAYGLRDKKEVLTEMLESAWSTSKGYGHWTISFEAPVYDNCNAIIEMSETTTNEDYNDAIYHIRKGELPIYDEDYLLLKDDEESKEIVKLRDTLYAMAERCYDYFMENRKEADNE